MKGLKAYGWLEHNQQRVWLEFDYQNLHARLLSNVRAGDMVDGCHSVPLCGHHCSRGTGGCLEDQRFLSLRYIQQSLTQTRRKLGWSYIYIYIWGPVLYSIGRKQVDRKKRGEGEFIISFAKVGEQCHTAEKNYYCVHTVVRSYKRASK